MSMHDYMPGIWCDVCKSLSPPDDPCRCGCCIECGQPLSEDETYTCDDCSVALLLDPNFDMTGEGDED